MCVADVSKCAGKEPAPPVCACSVKCAAGAVNVACPVCKLDMTGCMGKAPEPTTPPEPEYTITILSPSGWYTKAADVEIRVEDVNGTGWQKVEYKIERGGSWIDLTDDLTDRNRAKVEITENCTLYVTVTDKDGKAHTKSRYIECFDRTAPTVKAGIDGRLLRVEASDELSGVDAIFIDGDRYGDLTNGTLDVRLRDLGDDYSQLSIQAVDYAGKENGPGAIVIVVLVALAAGGAGYYFKVLKPKKELDDADDFEDIQFEDDPATGGADALPEPEEYEDDPAAEDEDGDELTGDPEDKEGGQ